MNENETLVAEEVATENAVQTAEETPAQKTYTQDEVNAMMQRRIARTEAKIRKEYRGHEELVRTLEAGTGTTGVGELTKAYSDYFKEKGLNVPDHSAYTDSDLERLARMDADEVIQYGDDEAADEFARLEKLGTNMTAREQKTFRHLAEHLQNAEMSKELAKMGVSEEVYKSKEFKDFAAQFKPDVPITKVYETYEKSLPKKEKTQMGSMKHTTSNENAVKEFYSPEEARKFTASDYNKNPALFEAVKRSMQKW